MGHQPRIIIIIILRNYKKGLIFFILLRVIRVYQSKILKQVQITLIKFISNVELRLFSNIMNFTAFTSYYKPVSMSVVADPVHKRL